MTNDIAYINYSKKVKDVLYKIYWGDTKTKTKI